MAISVPGHLKKPRPLFGSSISPYASPEIPSRVRKIFPKGFYGEMSPFVGEPEFFLPALGAREEAISRLLSELGATPKDLSNRALLPPAGFSTSFPSLHPQYQAAFGATPVDTRLDSRLLGQGLGRALFLQGRARQLGLLDLLGKAGALGTSAAATQLGLAGKRAGLMSQISQATKSAKRGAIGSIPIIGPAISGLF